MGDSITPWIGVEIIFRQNLFTFLQRTKKKSQKMAAKMSRLRLHIYKSDTIPN